MLKVAEGSGRVMQCVGMQSHEVNWAPNKKRQMGEGGAGGGGSSTGSAGEETERIHTSEI